jgi:hypothetical protein
MPRETVHYDRAHALAAQLLGVEAALDVDEIDGVAKRELLQTRALVESTLAVADALRELAGAGRQELRNAVDDVRRDLRDATYCSGGFGL